MKNNAFQISDWDDLVFENRNRMYGSYQERKRFADDTMRSLILVLAGIGILVLLPSFITRITEEEVVVKPDFGKVTTINPLIIEVEKKFFDNVKPPKLQPRHSAIIPTRVTTEEVVEKDEEVTVVDVDWGSAEGVEGGDSSALVFGDGEGSEFWEEPHKEDNNIYLTSAVHPKFKSGTADMVKFLSSKLKYPSRAKRENISGTIYVEFVVNKKGEVVNATVIRGIDRDCDKEALRVVSLMNEWTPGSQNGFPVNVRMVLPITFSLQAQ